MKKTGKIYEVTLQLFDPSGEIRTEIVFTDHFEISEAGHFFTYDEPLDHSEYVLEATEKAPPMVLPFKKGTFTPNTQIYGIKIKTVNPRRRQPEPKIYVPDTSKSIITP